MEDPYPVENENPQNFETQNGPRRGLDFIALEKTTITKFYPDFNLIYLDRIRIKCNKIWIEGHGLASSSSHVGIGYYEFNQYFWSFVIKPSW